MPDEEGNTGGEGVESPLHAYERGNEDMLEDDAENAPTKLEDAPDDAATTPKD